MFMASPPIRDQVSQDALWEGLSDGTVSFIGSDDCSYTYSEKSKYLERDENGEIIPDYTAVPGGTAGVEARLPIMCDGVAKGKITINQLCAVTSANIAKVYGCYPRKGVIAPGSDADFVVIDMNITQPITQDKLHNNLDFCPFEGIETTGWPVMTVSKGNVIVEDGVFKGEKGAGSFIYRKLDPKYMNEFGL